MLRNRDEEYSPHRSAVSPGSLFCCPQRNINQLEGVGENEEAHRSTNDSVPSAFHWPTSPVLNHPSFVNTFSSSFKSGRLKYPFVTDGPRTHTSPCGGLFVDKYPALGTSSNLISTDGTGSPTAPLCNSSGGR